VTEVSGTRAIKRWCGWGLIGAAIIGVIAAPNAILLFFLAAGLGWWLTVAKSAGDEEALQNYQAVQTRVLQAEAEWGKQNDGIEFVRLKQSLKNSKDTYEALPQEQTRRLDEYSRNRRAIQLHAHLDRLLIRNFEIPKIGQGRRAVLLSYGIETAANINEAAILRVPGFGAKTTQPLLNWRRHMESRFVFSAATTPADTAAINGIRADIAHKASKLKLELSTGPAKLTQLSTAIVAQQSASVPFIETLLRQRAQCVADLRALGRALPNVPRPTVAQRSMFSPTATQAPTISVSSNNPTNCPKCGGSMVIRLAMRGQHRGNKFYGCTKYPACNGTRSFP
jgi:DNA-binding helix-hairpin-helix protein with protein kinase domain